jgi:hypothetical protein
VAEGEAEDRVVAGSNPALGTITRTLFGKREPELRKILACLFVTKLYTGIEHIRSK